MGGGSEAGRVGELVGKFNPGRQLHLDSDVRGKGSVDVFSCLS